MRPRMASATGLPYASPGKEFAYQPFQDVEAQEEPLAPNLSRTENSLRLGFINKVYGILSMQLIATALATALIMFVQPVQSFVLGNPAVQIVGLLVPLLGLIPLYIYRQKHPHNLVLLGVWTLIFSIGVGTICSQYQPYVVLEALAITAGLVLGLSAFTYRAMKNGSDFSALGGILWVSLFSLVIWGFFQLFFPVGPVGQTIYALAGTVIFGLYIVYDTESLVQRYDLDDYIWASINLYLDIINLFLKILQLLGRRD